MEIPVILVLLVIFIIAMGAVAVFERTQDVAEQWIKAKYQNPERIKDIEAALKRYQKVIDMLDQDDLKALEARVAELSAQMKYGQMSSSLNKRL